MADRRKTISEIDRAFCNALKLLTEQEREITQLREQVETIPDKVGESPDIEGGGVIWCFCCGECRISIQNGWKYCPECGRRIKWT